MVCENESRRWRIGELARISGVTIRTLHHYDAIGLLVASERSDAGYRLYSEDDVHRLYKIIALRQLGVGLGEIAAVINGEQAQLQTLIARQLAATAEQLTRLQALRGRLGAIQASLDRGAVSIEQIIDTMEATAMYDKYYTPEQLEQLRDRGDRLGPDVIDAAQGEWAEIFTELGRHMQAGTDPSDPCLDPYRTRSRELLELFTGADPAITDAMRQMWDHEDPTQLSHGIVDTELFAYARRVFSSHRDEADLRP